MTATTGQPTQALASFLASLRKARNLAAFPCGASVEEITRIIDRAWDLENESDVRDLLDSGRRDG